MSAVAIVGRSKLDELAATVNTEHAAACQTGWESLMHGIAAGEALLEARESVPRGRWEQWVKENCDFAPARASDYMRIASHKDALLADVGVASMKTAFASLIANRLTTQTRFTLSECREIQRYGKRHGVRAAAEHFDISYGRAWRYAKGQLPLPKAEVKMRRAQAHVERSRAAEAQKVKRALRKKGAGASELYAMAEKMQDVLARAHAEEQDARSREAYARAGEHYRKMRDEIVRAVLGGGS